MTVCWLSPHSHPLLAAPSQAWVSATLDPAGHVSFSAASDSDLTAGLAGVLAAALSGLSPQQVLDFDAATFLQALNLGPAVLAPSRANGFANMLEAMRRRTRMLVTELPRFPSLLIGPDLAVPQVSLGSMWLLDAGAAHNETLLFPLSGVY